MTDSQEIVRMAAMMRLEIDDIDDMTKQIRDILGYFDILDSAGVEEGADGDEAISLNRLREDISEASGADTAYTARSAGGHIKAPGLG